MNKSLFRSQIPQRVHRLTVETNFEIQRRDLMRAGSHAPDGLSARDILALAHREIAVVRIRGKQIVAVFDNGQVAVTTKTAADVHHPARTSRAHHLPQLPEQQYAAAR